MDRQVIYDLFEQKVFENPDAPAVCDEQRKLPACSSCSLRTRLRHSSPHRRNGWEW